MVEDSASVARPLDERRLHNGGPRDRGPSRGPGGPFFTQARGRAGEADPEDPIRVVVVDDNDGFRESLVALLAAGGHQVVGQASNGLEALEVVAETDPDVVLMDIRMPAMDGIETTRRLKAAQPDRGIVALTAQEDDTVVREMLVAGASGYVLKDSDGDDILDAVSQAAAGRGVLSPAVTTGVIEQLTAALEAERLRAQELEEAHRALVERAARRHDLVARLGHELRTPVTVILGIAKTLADKPVDAPQHHDLLERLVNRAGALGRLVERFETVIDASSEDHLDVPELVREVVLPMPRVRVRADDGLPWVWGNRVLARKVLEELLDNAFRFAVAESPVDVSVGLDGSAIAVRVTDYGSGVRPEDADRIFEPLEQGESLDARTHQGAGVGLSLGRAAARAMDGDLQLERTGPEGSTFLWTLPVPMRHHVL
jgi:signal transduction histidine kinase